MVSPQPLSVGYTPGRSVVVVLWDLLADKVWNKDTPGWETYGSTPSHYRIPLTDPHNIGKYTAPYPAALTGVAVTQFAYDTEDLSTPIGTSLTAVQPLTAAEPLDTGAAVMQLVNRALGQLGVDAIVSFDDDSEAAAKAKLHWDCLRDSLLRAHYWKFASYTDTLPLIAGETVLQWQYLYAYPPKCLMIRKIFDESCMNPGGDLIFDMEYFGDLWLLRHPEFRYKETLSPNSFQKAIACNVNPAYIEYTYQVTDPNIWDQAFQDCMVFSLAAELAHPLTGNSDLMKKYTDLAAGIISEGKRLDAQEDNSTRPRMSSYVKARMG